MTLPRKVPPIPTTSALVRDIELERWVCERLHLQDLFAGVTSTETRRDRLKVVLLERGLTEAVAGSREGKSVKWGALYRQLYNCELTTTGD